jgi:hypothetical protein
VAAGPSAGANVTAAVGGLKEVSEVLLGRLALEGLQWSEPEN